MTKDIFLLLAALLTSYTLMYFSEKLFNKNRVQTFVRATFLILALAAIAVAATGIMSAAAGFTFTIGQPYLKVVVLIFSLFAAVYFCYYPTSSKRVLKFCIVFIPLLSTICMYGLYQSFDQHSSLISFYVYLFLGLATGFGLSFLLKVSDKKRVLSGQSLAILLASDSVYLLMESDWGKGPGTSNAQTLVRQPDLILWTTLLLLFISFSFGLFFKSKTKTSC